MAGKPKVKQDLARLTAMEEAVFDALARGESQEAIRAQFNVSRTAWERWMGSEAGSALYARARASAAHVLAEEVIQIADNVAEDSAAVSKGKLRADSRKWLASVWNREGYGEQHGPLVNIDLGSLHLNSLRGMNRRRIEEDGEAGSDVG